VPLPEFLNNTLGFFDDPSVAVVQGPQLFYNLDSFQHENSAWHEQRIFFHVIMPGKNRTNSAFWCGCPAVLRRSAIEAIGGIAQETVTEDLQTTIKLNKRGYRVVYTERPLAVGLSPATIADYFNQRFRWGQGAMQALRSKDSPLWTKGLTISQRLNFIASTITYFDGLQLLILLAIPLLTLFTGLLPVSKVGLELVARFVPYLVLIFLSNTLLGRGTYHFLHVERYSLLRSFTFASTLPTLLTGKARPFRVTNKEAGGGTDLMAWGKVTPHLVTIGLCVLAVAAGITHLYHPIWYKLDSFPLAIIIMWTTINAALLTEGVSRLLGVSRRSRYRFPVAANMRWRRLADDNWYARRSINLSTTGINFEQSETKLGLGEPVEIAISAVTPNTRPQAGEDAGSLVADSSRVLFTGHVVNSHLSRQQTSQRLGVFIDKFSTETDANNYTHLLHSPAHLLRGEQVFHPPDKST
jgi:cellulose synthase (UDP-forming)